MDGRRDDRGFTLVEVTVAVAIIAVVMLGLGAVFVATASGTDVAGARQTASRIATDGLDRVRGVTPGTLVQGRDTTSVGAQWRTRPADVASLLSTLTPATDATAPVGAGATAALPTTAPTSRVDGVAYAQAFYVALCFLDRTTVCRATALAGTVPMYDVVVSVSWPHASCRRGTCSSTVSTLVTASATDPQFNSNVQAAGPVVAAIGAQVNDVDEQVTLPKIVVTGGNGASTLTVTGLPAGLRFDSEKGVIHGSPTAAGPPVTVQVTATDRFGLFGTAEFTWTVNARPTLADGTATLVAGVVNAVDLNAALKLTGGTRPFRAWTCTGLPPLATLDAATGALSLPATVLGVFTPSCTVTDARGVTTPAAGLALSVLAPVTVTSPATATTLTLNRVTTVRQPVVATGCLGPCTWTVSPLPAGLTFDPVTATITGRPTRAGTTTVTVTATDTLGRTATSTTTWRVL